MFSEWDRRDQTGRVLERHSNAIWEAKGWKFVDVLREVENRINQDRIRVIINTQYISARDYIVEQGQDGLIFKFIKNRFGFNLDDDDYIEVTGDIEQYA